MTTHKQAKHAKPTRPKQTPRELRKEPKSNSPPTTRAFSKWVADVQQQLTLIRLDQQGDHRAIAAIGAVMEKISEHTAVLVRHVDRLLHEKETLARPGLEAICNRLVLAEDDIETILKYSPAIARMKDSGVAT